MISSNMGIVLFMVHCMLLQCKFVIFIGLLPEIIVINRIPETNDHVELAVAVQAADQHACFPYVVGRAQQVSIPVEKIDLSAFT